MPTAILLARGPLRKGVSAALTGFVYASGGTIVGHDQYVDPERQRYYTRLEWEIGSSRIPRSDLASAVADATRPFDLGVDVGFSDVAPRVAIFVSSLAHCLYDILGRCRSGEWNI